MSAGEWGAVLGILANVREEANATQAVISDDDDQVLPSLRYIASETQRAIDLARAQTLAEAGA